MPRSLWEAADRDLTKFVRRDDQTGVMTSGMSPLIRYAAHSGAGEDGIHAQPEDTMTMLETTGTVGTVTEALTRRERVVLAELAEDVTLEEIATRLFVTRNT